jgi:hypothetical protein
MPEEQKMGWRTWRTDESDGPTAPHDQRRLEEAERGRGIVQLIGGDREDAVEWAVSVWKQSRLKGGGRSGRTYQMMEKIESVQLIKR